ncbi:MAG: hypothetical protein M1127_02365 [Patescibacteria group bacterium]|nr:hypothetical protein [Patescibacteria group bacterium]
MNKKIFLPVLSFVSLIVAKTASAVCPVCTVAVGACVGLARWLKIDDRITGKNIFLLIVSLIWWTIDFLNKKNIRFYGRKIIITFGYYLIILLPLKFTNVIGHPFNKCWGMDKLLWGIIIGSAAFLLLSFLHLKLKQKNQNKSYFPYQRVIVPVVPLLILSLILYFVFKAI